MMPSKSVRPFDTLPTQRLNALIFIKRASWWMRRVLRTRKRHSSGWYIYMIYGNSFPSDVCVKLEI